MKRFIPASPPFNPEAFMADFKPLHDEWKEKKKSAEACWDNLDRMTRTLAGDIGGNVIDHAVMKFPGFSAGLGPALDNLTKATAEVVKKDKKPADLEKIKATIKKEKEIAKKAVMQYSGDLVKLDLDRSKLASKTKAPVKTETNKDYFEKLNKRFEVVTNALKLVQTSLNNLSATLTKIDKQLNEVKV